MKMEISNLLEITPSNNGIYWLCDVFTLNTIFSIYPTRAS